jgi:AcrR family transcriptional regulator
MASSARTKRRAYHHGNLREALIAAARELIAERGPVGFTLVEAARRAGVSPAAPYRHFRDRDALVAEICRRGFEEFGKRLGTAWARAEQDPRGAFAGMGEAYLAFAREEPGYYNAMFTPGPKPTRSPTPAEGDAFDVLQAAIARIAPGDARAKSRLAGLAFQVWALSHGIATLTAAGYFNPPDRRITPEETLKAGVAALIEGAEVRRRQPAAAAAKSSSSERRRVRRGAGASGGP